eukprot:tig00000870_g5151.t1
MGFARLPVELLARVLSFLPFEKAWRLRGVSKLWRSAAEGAECETVKLGGSRIASSKPDAAGKSLAELNAFTALAKKKDLRRHMRSACIDIYAGPHLSLSEEGEDREEEAARARTAVLRLVAAACGALAAITPSAEILASSSAEQLPSPWRQQRDLEVTLFLDDPSNDDLDEIFPASEDLAQSFVLGVLSALRPLPAGAAPRPAAAPASPAESLKIDVFRDDDTWRPWTPDADVLRTFLAPFSKLRALELGYDACKITAAAAAAIAECCSRLSAINLQPSDAEAIGELAALPLERLIVNLAPRTRFSGSIARLGAGRAAQTLEDIWVEYVDRTHEIGSDDLRALPRFLKLESFRTVLLDADHVSRDDVACLGAVPKLRELHLRVPRGAADSVTAVLRGLADALRASPSLHIVHLNVPSANPDGPELTDLVSAASRLKHLRLKIDVGRALTAAEAETLASLRVRARAEVSVSCTAATLADVLAFQVLVRAPEREVEQRGKHFRSVSTSMTTFHVAVPDDGVREIAQSLVAAWLPPSSGVSIKFSEAT